MRRGNPASCGGNVEMTARGPAGRQRKQQACGRSRSGEGVQRAWYDLLQRYAWTHFCTLTFASPVSAAEVVRRFNGFVRKLEREGYGPVWASYVVDEGMLELAHVHALILAPPELELDRTRVLGLWGYGRQVHVEPYDSDERAIGYLVAKLRDGAQRGVGEPDFTRRMNKAPRRHSGDTHRAHIRDAGVGKGPLRGCVARAVALRKTSYRDRFSNVAACATPRRCVA